MTGRQELGEVPVALDRPRLFKFTMWSHAMFEDERGFDASLMFRADPDDPNRTIKQTTTMNMFAFIWAGLIHQDKELTIQDVCDIVERMVKTRMRASGDVAQSITSVLTETFQLAAQAYVMSFEPDEEKKRVVREVWRTAQKNGTGQPQQEPPRESGSDLTSSGISQSESSIESSTRTSSEKQEGDPQ